MVSLSLSPWIDICVRFLLVLNVIPEGWKSGVMDHEEKRLLEGRETREGEDAEVMTMRMAWAVVYHEGWTQCALWFFQSSFW